MKLPSIFIWTKSLCPPWRFNLHLHVGNAESVFLALPALFLPAMGSLRQWAEASPAAGAVLRDRHSKEKWKGAKLAGGAVGTKGEGVKRQGEGGVRGSHV